jgi:hypothetical protein
MNDAHQPNHEGDMARNNEIQYACDHVTCAECAQRRSSATPDRWLSMEAVGYPGLAGASGSEKLDSNTRTVCGGTRQIVILRHKHA